MLPRRTILRGLGASITLPFLESLQPRRAFAVASRPPLRLGFLFFPNGVRPGAWLTHPDSPELDLGASPILEPLSAHQPNLTLLSNLMHAKASGGDGHYAKSANWLTGGRVFKTTGQDICVGGASVDQAYAQAHGHLTKLPSLELGTEPATRGVDLNVNFTRLYGSHISWRDANTPLPCEINPRLAFDRLFRPSNTSPQQLADQRSVLDLVLDQANDLRRHIGHDDQRKLDEYLESVRSVERRIEHDLQRVSSGENLDPSITAETDKLDARINHMMAAQPDAGARPRFDHTEHSRIMLDLIVLAFWSDSTRAATFMFGNDVSSKDFSFLDGVDGGHHHLSHHEGDAHKLDQYQRINRWHADQFAYMLDRMAALPDGDATLLDNSAILFGSSLNDGNQHSYHDLPLVLAGRARGAVNPGRHLRSSDRTPLCNLYSSLLHSAEVPLESFGDASATLSLS